MQNIEETFSMLFNIARRKKEYDVDNSWAEGSQTYLNEIRKELIEVEEELTEERNCYLEDELGDVLWDYLNILLMLEKERNIKTASVLSRACKKYEARISAIERGQSWDSIKETQKKELAREHEEAPISG